MNNRIRVRRQKDTRGNENRTPGLISLTGPPCSFNALGQAAEKAAKPALQRQYGCNKETAISNCSEESVKKFNLLLNKMHNLVDTSPDKPKMGLSEIPVVEHSRSEV